MEVAYKTTAVFDGDKIIVTKVTKEMGKLVDGKIEGASRKINGVLLPVSKMVEEEIQISENLDLDAINADYGVIEIVDGEPSSKYFK